MTERVFNRRVEFDEKSRGFPIRTLLPDKPPRSYTWSSYEVLDQGSEGACVGFGWSQELLARPVVIREVTNAFAHQVYEDAKKVDEWPGEDYDGTSVLAGAKVIKARGYMAEYRWGFNLNDLVMAIGYAGPVVLGLNWYTGMMDTDAAGYLHVTGNIEGGHCIAATSVSVRQQRIGLVNSWGEGWGVRGRCYLSWADMDRLLHEQGEQCIPMGRQQV